jgi:hypothetical protein
MDRSKESGLNRADPLHYDQEPESTDNGGFLSLVPEQREKDVAIYDDALNLAVDFIEASGGANLGFDHYKMLHEDGWIDHNVAEVLRVFQDDWALLQADAIHEYRDRQEAEQAKKSALLKEIDDIQNSGTLPTHLFSNLERRISPKLSRRRARLGNIVYEPDIAVVTNHQVDDDEKIIRYTRFVVAKRLAAGMDVSDSRIRDAVLGVNFKNDEATEGALAHTYLYELEQATKKKIDRIDVELAAERAGWFRWVFPEIKQEHLRELRESSGYVPQPTPAKSEPEALVAKHYFDLKTGSVIEEQFIPIIEKSQQWDNLYDNIRELGEFLQGVHPIPAGPIRPRGYLDGYIKPITSEWPREKYVQNIKALFLILKSVEHYDTPNKLISRNVLRRARVLGLSPGYPITRKAFDGSISELYKQAGISTAYAHSAKRFTSWTEDDHMRHLQNLTTELGHFPTEEDIREKARQNPNNPGYTAVIKALGHLGSYNEIKLQNGTFVSKLYDNNALVGWGVDFMLANDGILPTSRHLNFFSSTKKAGPSTRVVNGRFGNIPHYQDKVMLSYQKRLLEIQEQRAEKMNYMNEVVSTNSEYANLLTHITSEDEAVQIFAKYQILSSVFPEWPPSTREVIAIDGINSKDFLQSISLIHPDADIEEIKEIAKKLGYYDYVWPPKYLENLKLDQSYDKSVASINKKRRDAAKKK